MHVAGEEVADRREIGHGGGRADGPRASGAGLGFVTLGVADREHADQRVIGRGDLLGLVDQTRVGGVGFGNGKDHVRLAGAEPHLADEHVGQF